MMTLPIAHLQLLLQENLKEAAGGFACTSTKVVRLNFKLPGVQKLEPPLLVKCAEEGFNKDYFVVEYSYCLNIDLLH